MREINTVSIQSVCKISPDYKVTINFPVYDNKIDKRTITGLLFLLFVDYTRQSSLQLFLSSPLDIGEKCKTFCKYANKRIGTYYLNSEHPVYDTHISMKFIKIDK